MYNAESMQDVSGPFLWIFSTGISLIILFLTGAIYFWYRYRLRSMLKDGEDLADLAKKKDLLQTEIQRSDEWIKTNREELMHLDAERKMQEELRVNLADLQKRVAQEQQKVDDLVKEPQALRAAVAALSQERDNLLKEKDSLSKQIGGFNATFDVNKKAAEDAALTVQNLKEELDDLQQKQKKGTEKLSALSKTITGLDDQRQSLTMEMAVKREQLSQIKKEMDPLSQQLEGFKAIFDVNKKTAEDEALMAQNLKKELDSLQQKQKEETEKLSALSKTISELDAQRQSLTLEVASKNEHLSQINDKTAETRKTFHKLESEISALKTFKENLNKLKKEFGKIKA